MTKENIRRLKDGEEVADHLEHQKNDPVVRSQGFLFETIYSRLGAEEFDNPIMLMVADNKSSLRFLQSPHGSPGELPPSKKRKCSENNNPTKRNTNKKFYPYSCQQCWGMP